MKAYYIYSGGQKYQVSKELYSEINHTTNQIHYRRCNAKQCRANQRQRARCEGDCYCCRYYVNQPADIDDTWLVSHRASNVNSLSDAENQISCDELLDAMQAAVPDGRRIGQLYLLRFKDAEIARILGISKSAFARRKAKIKAHLRKYLAQHT